MWIQKDVDSKRNLIIPENKVRDIPIIAVITRELTPF